MAKNKLDFAISKWNVKSIDNQECLIQIRSAIKSLAALSSLYSNARLCVEDELQFSSLRNVVALEKSKGISSAFPSIALYDACGLRGLKAAKKESSRTCSRPGIGQQGSASGHPGRKKPSTAVSTVFQFA